MKRIGYLHEQVYDIENIEKADDKDFLRRVLIAIKMYLKEVLNLRLKSNYQIFPVDVRGIDFVGYRFYHTHVLLRKSIKIRLFWLAEIL